MNPFKAVLPVCIVVLSFAAGGCSATVDGSEETGSAEVATANPSPSPGEFNPSARHISGLDVLGPTFTEGALAPHGGGGGAFTGHVTPAAVIFGVQTRSGTMVDAISFGYYQPVWSDNVWRTGDPFAWTGFYGGGGGGLNAAFICPAGQGVIGLRGNSGSRVDRIGVICGNVNSPNPVDPANTYSPLWGGGGGGWFGEDKCTSNRLVDSFNIRSGSALDNIQAICIAAH